MTPTNQLTSEPMNLKDLVQPMNESEARDCVKAINRAVSVAGESLLKLHSRKGWEALGYKTWEECVDGEFSVSRATVFRHLRIAQVESDIAEKSQVETSGAPKLNDRQAKALSVVPPEQRKEVWEKTKAKTGLANPPAPAIEETLNDLPANPPTQPEPKPTVEPDTKIQDACKYLKGSKLIEKTALNLEELLAHWPEMTPQIVIMLRKYLGLCESNKSNVLTLERKTA